MQMIIICGVGRVGKSTVAKLIADKVFDQGQIPKILSFAGPIKKDAERRGYSKDDNPDKYREYCQEIGNGMRQEDPDYWVKIFDGDVKNVLRQEEKCIETDSKFWEHVIIVDDCRYINEVAYGKLNDATLLFVHRGDREIPEMGNEWRDHPSESMSESLSGGNDALIRVFDDIIYNDNSQKDLKKTIDANTPVWSGYEVDCSTECSCPSCVSRKSYKDMPKLKDLMDGLFDVLFLDDLEEEEEYDEDDNAEESDT